jgi:hypothetical protein
MTSALFETERFRVHITGKAVWVEAKVGANWVFCNWHALPVSADCSESEALRAAVADYAAAREGDTSLQSALTGIRQDSVRTAIRQSSHSAVRYPAKAAIAPAKSQRSASSTRAKKSSGNYGFRAPLRPPLLAPSVASLAPHAAGN